MFIRAHDCHHRSAIKAVSWRALGSLDTFVLSYFITGSFVFAGSIASAETCTKVFLYYLHGGPRSRDALRAFKEAHDLGADDLWDEQTESMLFGSTTKPSGNFVGVWAADVSACSAGSNRKGFVPAVIRFDGAQAGETICAFDTRKRTPGAWNASATCSNGRERWKTNVQLVADGNRLTWTSQRGTQTYVRCSSSMQMAGLH